MDDAFSRGDLSFPEKDGSRLRILFLDKEGGFGGSSRSLYFLIKNLDRGKIVPCVALRERGPALKLYREMGIKILIMAHLPVYKPSPRNNLFVLFLFMMRFHEFLSACRLLSRLIREEGIDIIHMNHDSFFIYGFFLRRFTKAKILVHMRTMLPENGFASFQAKCIEVIADHLIFISENELNRYCELLGRRIAKSAIVFNAAETFEGIPGLSAKEADVFKVLYLGNLTYNKGADRLIDITLHMKSRGMNDIVFVVCGEDRGEKGKKIKETMASRAERSGVQPYFRFMGHQAEPDRFLEEADILIRLSRWNDPWGRDIIEAMAYGKPIIATGTYEGFVKHGINGFLHPEYNPAEIAEEIIFLARHPEVCKRVGETNREKARKLFDGARNAAKVATIYQSVMKR